MKTSLKLITIAAIGVVGLGGLASVFAPSASARGIFAAHKQQAPQAPAEASDGDGETNDDVQSAEESARLQALATITPQQAQQTAEQQMGKPADKVEIENDDGSLVYAVSFGQQDVKVDAGNGQILYTDNQNDGENDAAHPKGSIQLSGTDAGDGDGETNDDG
jgi:uncharacterized membrane protein YkoI